MSIMFQRHYPPGFRQELPEPSASSRPVYSPATAGLMTCDGRCIPQRHSVCSPGDYSALVLFVDHSQHQVTRECWRCSAISVERQSAAGLYAALQMHTLIEIRSVCHNGKISMKSTVWFRGFSHNNQIPAKYMRIAEWVLIPINNVNLLITYTTEINR